MDDFIINLLETYIKSHPSILLIFFFCSLVVNIIRIFGPKKSPHWLQIILYILDVGAYNFWGLLRLKKLKANLNLPIKKVRRRKRKNTKLRVNKIPVIQKS